MEPLIECISKCQEYKDQFLDNSIYYLISIKWLNKSKIIAQTQDINKLNTISILNLDLVDDYYSNILSYDDPLYNYFLNEKSKLNIDYLCIPQDLWESLVTTLQNLNKIPLEYYTFKTLFKDGTFINKNLKIQLIPLYEGVTNIIEGVQCFSRDWTIQDINQNFEKLLNQQLTIQVPPKNFIKFYALKNVPQDFKQLVKWFHENQLVVEEFKFDTHQLNNGQFLILDIQVLNRNFYFKQDNNHLDQRIHISLEETEISNKGFSVYESQQSLLSCLFKNYESSNKIRNFIKNNFKDYFNLNEIIEESYYGSQAVLCYESKDIELLKEHSVTITESRHDTVYVNGQPQKVFFDHKMTVKQLAEKFLPESDFLFECSNNNYTETINPDTPLCQLPKDYIYNLNKRQQSEEELEITINRCFVEKVGILKSYRNFDAIRKIYINKQSKFFDLHVEIANIFEETNLTDYKEKIFNKKYELIFQTNQQGNERCSFCDQKLCNNCIVKFIDQKLILKMNKVVVYAIYNEPIQNEREKPEIIKNYNLEDYFDFQKTEEEFLILDINQDQIHTHQMSYPLSIHKYQLCGLIENIDRSNYQCYCKIQEKWTLFNNEGFKQADEIVQNLKVVKLFYEKIN
ncbi:unnamed protein product (macronuclear) [Paramecium tetraurelia]|uniref:DUSP domain-containing protein n=1 Tax=Paramecium tetraurelia TaxID=5888 RepID=A0CJZ4_PARTE|nr:uncharacterized protein GSPATT00000823001 [Paramecium tetraurelia]CAK71111.1 unnamed protein product [Paramecium tetraurelia]|eukprot:XP_001438508.1 hypothetical protein (macronuclear) [Paramecium tetraurelia strain d4-2]